MCLGNIGVRRPPRAVAWTLAGGLLCNSAAALLPRLLGADSLPAGSPSLHTLEFLRGFLEGVGITLLILSLILGRRARR
ncbi:MAG: hypothetical protein ABFD65_04840 [Candidatus Polarisedimenticolia bacterium]|nr:hypothetical protein [bacterium]